MAQDGEGIPEHLLGYRSDPKWRDMSNWLVHFTDREETFLSILRDGEIRAVRPFGSAMNLEDNLHNQKAICLSEIPVDQLDRLMKRHGRWGLAFTRNFIRAAGGARVWYLDQDMPTQLAFRELGTQAMRGSINPADEIWTLTPFVDRVAPGKYEFEWEREWRVVGGLRFTPSDLAFTLTPDGISQKMEQISIEAPNVRHDGTETGWVAIPEAVGNELDRMTAEFLENFSDPNLHLTWEKGEYFWVVPEWRTGEAVESVFPKLEGELLDQLVDYLNGLSDQVGESQ
ncbi:hypothetical protein AB0M46_28575 [Dactylosporangium sp. NPDC051485]|uniref:hypothetical protein n=1 Tax=Dactylosporangium sp. NPDC051485 TaxID=3154846 RepID=UPI003412CD8A